MGMRSHGRSVCFAAQKGCALLPRRRGERLVAHRFAGGQWPVFAGFAGSTFEPWHKLLNRFAGSTLDRVRRRQSGGGREGERARGREGERGSAGWKPAARTAWKGLCSGRRGWVRAG